MHCSAAIPWLFQILNFCNFNFQPKWHLYIKLLKKKTCQCPGGPVLRTLALLRALVQSLVGELSSPQVVSYGQKEIFIISKVKWFAGPMERQTEEHRKSDIPRCGTLDSMCTCMPVGVYAHVHTHTQSQPTRLLGPWDFSGKNTGAGCHFVLQGIFPT